MEVAQVLHMAGGVGEKSYASNSLLQRKAITKAKPVVEKALTDVYSTVLPKSMAVVDLGCSSGPNAFVVAGEIVDIIGETSNKLGHVAPEIQYFMNDLPGNDFNTLFRYLTPFQEKIKGDEGPRTTVPLYITGVPGSFYSRLFPRDSIHFVHSSFCLHYLSQVPYGAETKSDNPTNKQNIHLSWTSPPSMLQSYMEQFQKDFTLFLKLRSEEVINGGCMVLVLLGRGSANPLGGECSHLFKLLANALTDMALEGLIEEEKVDSFNLPYYTPSIEELRAVIYDEGSFDIVQCESFQLNWDPTDDALDDFVSNNSKSGENVAESLRPVFVSMLIDHFGEVMIDDLFSRYAHNLAMHLSKEKTKYVILIISLKNKKAIKIV